MDILIPCGGRSAEHEISLMSASFIYSTLRNSYTCHPVYIDRSGNWYYLGSIPPEELHQCSSKLPSTAVLSALWHVKNKPVLWSLDTRSVITPLDVAFPALHGPYGEDGTIQGLFEIINLPYVGSDVTGSAIVMDKASTKAILKARGLPTPAYYIIDLNDGMATIPQHLNTIQTQFTLPVFVKPSRLGSSIGIARVNHWNELEPAIRTAALFGSSILVEQGITPVREVECSVLDGSPPQASIIGEITYRTAFYDYHAKYRDPETKLHIPADIPPSIADTIRTLAVQAFQALRCNGMARADFFLRGNEIFINELNTIPGFTPFSMYHRLWSATGIEPPELLNKLLNLALEHHRKKQEFDLYPPKCDNP